MIDSLFHKLTKDYKNLSYSYILKEKTAKIGNFYEIKALEPYKLEYNCEAHYIHTFYELGWPDPFPYKQAVNLTSFDRDQFTNVWVLKD